jgi:hypothetical protein
MQWRIIKARAQKGKLATTIAEPRMEMYDTSGVYIGDVGVYAISRNFTYAQFVCYCYAIRKSKVASIPMDHLSPVATLTLS